MKILQLVFIGILGTVLVLALLVAMFFEWLFGTDCCPSCGGQLIPWNTDPLDPKPYCKNCGRKF